MELPKPKQGEDNHDANSGELYMPYEAQDVLDTEGDKEDSPRNASPPGEAKIESVHVEDLFVKPQEDLPPQPDPAALAPVNAKEAHEFIATLLESNPVFRTFPVLKNTPSQRTALPCRRDPNARLNVWELLKSNIGKDLSRIAMPVYLNDPISMLQKVAELLEFTDYLKKANNCADPYMRLAYIAVFFYALNPYSINRLKKPFNPLLGETFEYCENGIRFIAEQVSHHPPISAFYCESDDFTFEGYYNMKSTISMSGFVVTPKGPFTIKLLKTKETFTFSRQKTSLHNIIIGNMYLWHYGDSEVVNQTTKDKLVLNYKAKGWTSTHDYECDGEIFDSQGNVKLKLIGKWNSYLNIVNEKGEETQIFTAPQLPPSAEDYYHFSNFIINLNHLTPEQINSLPPTDTRFRPDQRAYENGDLQLATDEKLRLEENQRIRRKALEASNSHFTPLWFYHSTDKNKEVVFQYNGKYFPMKDMKAWPKQILNLYN